MGLVAASVVTGLFLAAVGLVLAWPIITAPRDEGFVNVAPGGPIFAMQEPAPVQQPLAPHELPKVRGEVVRVRDYNLSAPVNHGNLTIYLVHGKDTIDAAKILTLQEALEQNVATVRDTGFNLTIDNRSNAALFIQSGDIVKGGNQDRTLPYDMLIPANSAGTTMAALCVEQGRSFPRGNEVSTSFATATEQLPTRQLKLAAYRQAQNEVWNNVRVLQGNLERSAGGSVKANLSESSLQLSLEHQRVQTAVQDYMVKLAPSTAGKNDVIGYVAVVNGNIQSADVYASNALFLKLWPKLIRASAVEALAEGQRGDVDAPDAAAVRAFLANAEKGNPSQVQAGRSTVVRHESAQALLHDTCDPTRNNAVLHRSFLAK
jgi:hypothetical protein